MSTESAGYSCNSTHKVQRIQNCANLCKIYILYNLLWQLSLVQTLQSTKITVISLFLLQDLFYCRSLAVVFSCPDPQLQMTKNDLDLSILPHKVYQCHKFRKQNSLQVVNPLTAELS